MLNVNIYRIAPLAALVFATFFTAGTVAFAQEQTAPVASATAPVASARKIVLLPVINASGEKDLKQRQDQATKGNEELEKIFHERGFTIVPAQEVQAALQSTGVDLTDEENHNRATLYKVGKALNADLIAFVLIEDVQQFRGKSPVTDSQELVAKVRTKTWLLNVAEEKPILNAVRQESQSKNSFTAEFDSGARRMRNTVPGAIRDTFRSFLNDYPKVAKK